MLDRRAVVVALLLAACERSASTQSPTADGSRSGEAAAQNTAGGSAADGPRRDSGSSATDELPPAAPAVADSLLRKEARCGPFSSHDLVKKDRALLEERLRVHFFKGGNVQGDAHAARLQLERGGVTMFVGAREMFQRGDASFERRAAKAATFKGDYEAVTIPGRDASVSIVTGMVRDPDPGRDMLAVAHGWFLDPNRDVLDVAVFVSTNVSDLDGCRHLAQIIMHTVGNGARRLASPPAGETVTTVSYAKFRYVLSDGWMLASSMGIHDFARISFRRRGTFPDGFAAVEVGLDSHPGDWTSPGVAMGDRDGVIFGVPVHWHITDDTASSMFGAWTISDTLIGEDHVVAAIHAGDPQGRDEALAFAQSIRVDP